MGEGFFWPIPVFTNVAKVDVSKLEMARKNLKKKLTSRSDYYRYISVESNSAVDYRHRF